MADQKKGYYTKDGYFIRPVPDPQPGKIVKVRRDVPGDIAELPQHKAAAVPDIPLLIGEDIPWVIRPPWIDPPKTARIVDVAVGPIALAAGATNVLIGGYQVPDRYVGMFFDFGNALTNPLLYGTVQWSILINNAPEEFYNQFTQQLGTFVRPTRFPRSIPVKYNDIIAVVASNPSGVATTAFMRLRGYIFPVEEESLSKYMTF